MPLIKNGAETVNTWTFHEGEGDLPADGQFTLTLATFLAHKDDVLARNADIGVRLSPEDDPTKLEPFLDRISLIEVDFPKYTDGRGYSQAQLLRRRFAYQGELRAIGHVLRDQIFYMNRSGFDTYETTRADLSSIVEALAEYTEVYQPAAGNMVSVFKKRHL
jgi:uncharacterized protein (DUF934 family)